MVEVIATMICKGQLTYDSAIEKHPELKIELDQRLGNVKIERNLYENHNHENRFRARHRVR